MRSGSIAKLNAAPIYEGEFLGENRMTGEYKFDFNAKKSSKIIGYVGYLKTTSGFEKTMF